MLGALRLEVVVAEIQTRHRPDGEKYIRGGTEGIFLYLLALGEEGSKHDGARNAKLLLTKVSFKH